MSEGPAPNPRARVLLVALLALSGALLALRAAAQWQLDPFVRAPINDARVYWSWSSEIAHGKLVGDTPCFSAPLYPYLLGGLRALCCDSLLAPIALQIALQLGTAALLWHIARRFLTERGALLAPLVWLLLADPAYASLRVLNTALGALLVAWLWERLLALQAEVRPRHVLGTALVLGLNVLANPVLLFAIPIIAFWLWRIARRGLVPAAGFVLVALACVAPATLHNWLACHEFIPVSAQAGITFAHGNAQGADGTYHAVPGVSSDRVQQNFDARELVRGESDGSWSGTDRAFLRRGLRFWADEPGAALALALRKAWWFVSGRHYGDIYIPALEAQAGLDPWSPSAPLPAAWLMLPALLVLVIARREGRRLFPELLLLGAFFGTVVVFWYSPRYRLPALPILAVLTAQGLALLLESRARDTRGALVALALLGSAATGTINGWIGFDSLEGFRPAHEHSLATALAYEGRLEEALAHERRAALAGDMDASVAAGDLLRRLGRMPEALLALSEAAEANPRSAFARKSYAIALAQSSELEGARGEFEAALALAPGDPETLSGLGNVRMQLGDARGAIEAQRAALARNPRLLPARIALGWLLAASSEPALRDPEAALKLEDALLREHALPEASCLDLRAATLATAGRFADAVEAAAQAERLLAADPARAAELAQVRGRLALYRSGRAYVQGSR
ncbi:MAG: hypothetical protein IPJ19_09415 [Planctomycetes bacterium]|nr:hypothetical protein [Planctomycetota bacterium]